MKPQARYALCISVATALLAGCGGSEPPIGAPGVTPQSHVAAEAPIVASADAIKSAAKGRPLLYITSGIEAAFVYSYPGLKFLGTLGYFVGAGGECADDAGNVFIATDDGLLEYPHGGAEPIHTLNIAGSCSRDPVTGNLAVVHDTQMLIYRYTKLGWHFPRAYTLSFMGYFCGYDNSGNLFVDGSSNSTFAFAELKKGTRAFTGIEVNQAIKTAGQVQWDGKYIAIGDSGIAPSVIYQFSVSGSSATKVGSTTLLGSEGMGQFWIQNSYVVVPAYYYGEIGLWKYPQGGHMIRSVASDTSFGAAVSVAPH
jgi:hypothetical protein